MTAFLRRRRGEAPDGEALDRRLVLPMILGAILNPINSTMLAVALVPIGIAFGAPASQTAWLVTGLYLATAVGQPVVGRLIDLYGPRRLYLLGAVLIGVGGVVGTVAPSLGVLVLARVLIGFGTCAGYPAAMNLIRSEAERTGRESPQTILTVLAVSTQTVAVVGPTLGGLLIAIGGWHATFAVNVPLALACLVLGAWRLPREPLAGREARVGLAARIDLAGIVAVHRDARGAAAVPRPPRAPARRPPGARGRRGRGAGVVGAARGVAVPRPARTRRQRPAARDLRALAAHRGLVVLAALRLHAVARGGPRPAPLGRRADPAAGVRRRDRGLDTHRPQPRDPREAPRRAR